MLGLNLTQEPRAIREAKEEERVEGREVEAIALVTRLLTRQLRQELPQEMLSRIHALSLEQLENLGEALLEFEVIADLEAWLGALE
ncbi:DUF4351 domain-containing protein [Nostoc sp.]|uniref:DUF4351 domain-containing protein n=1 Tax=Nostoc sp. TaxID=1180 RepID=UPI002FFA9763